MALRDILVLLDPSEACDDRVRAAIALAKAHGARLTGVEATSEAAFQGRWAQRARNVATEFEAALAGAELPRRLIALDPHAGHDPAPALIGDLIIAPRPEGEARELVLPFVPEALVLHSGVPTLIVPPDWRLAPIGRHVVIAWNGSAVALRAAHDALPILRKAERVTVFAFSPVPSGLRASAETLVEHLAQHGVKADISDWTHTGDITAVEAMFASLDTQDADLVVAGGFGHSRAWEGLFGGVSLDLLRQPSLPLLMSH